MKINPKKRFGQNFLNDDDVIKNIINVSKITKNDEVLEVGPGRGALTRHLLLNSKNVIAYELDRDLISILKNSLPQKNLTLLNVDFLKSEFDWENKKIVVANIPYYITSDILFKIFHNVAFFDRAILMVQKEVADRLCAKVGTHNYGKLSVVTQYFAHPSIAIEVPSSAFNPQPKVNSAVVILKFKTPIFNSLDTKGFLNFVKNCFRMRRKKITNNLKKMDINLSEKQLVALKINDNSRPQELSLNQYIQLFNMFK